MIYFVIIFLLLILSFQYDYLQRKTGREICFWFIYVVLVLVAGLRFRLGQDTVVYMKFFENLQPITHLSPHDIQDSRFAPGFIILASIFRTLGPDFVNFQIFHSLIVNTVFLLFLKRNTRHLFFSILLFFLFLYFLLLFQQMRESIAASIFILAWPALIRKKWILWFGAAFLALFFHVSSIFMFVLPLIYIPGIRNIFRFTKYTPIIVLCIVALGFIIQSFFFKYVQLIAVTEAMMERATTYSRSDLASATFNLFGMIGKIFQWILYPLLAMIFLFGKKYRDPNKDYSRLNKIENMVILSLYVSALGISIPIIGRYNNYFYIFSVLIMSEWVFTYVYFLGKKTRLQFFSWFIVFLPMFCFQLQNTYIGPVNKSGTLRGYMVYYPYSSYIEKSQDDNREKAIRYIIRNVK